VPRGFAPGSDGPRWLLPDASEAQIELFAARIERELSERNDRGDRAYRLSREHRWFGIRPIAAREHRGSAGPSGRRHVRAKAQSPRLAALAGPGKPAAQQLRSRRDMSFAKTLDFCRSAPHQS
jgi:hypothetical protein